MFVTQFDYPLILASRSPRRKELLIQIGVPFETMDIEIDETVNENEAPISYVQRVAYEKASAALKSKSLHKFEDYKNRAILCADTSVVRDNEILGKPKDESNALAMLKSLSGRTHQVMTSVALVSHGEIFTQTSITEVEFDSLSESQIKAYCDTGEGIDKAGAYAIQGKAAQFVIGIKGSYSGVVGLPLNETSKLLMAHYQNSAS